MVTKELRKIATKVRKQAEDLQDETKHWCGDLGEMCAIASMMLYKRLKKEGYRPAIVVGFGHVYVYCKGYFIDITATQFGPYPKVIVRKEMPNEDFWEKNQVIRSEKALKQFFKIWPKYQNPYKWENLAPNTSGY